MTVTDELSQTKWIGRGPHETYPDRKTGGEFGCYELPSNLLKHDYMRPQENGLRTDCINLEISSNKSSLKVDTNDSFMFSVWPYKMKSLDDATHIYKLKDEKLYTVNIDGYHQGVGGDEPGALVLTEKYKLKKGKVYEYDFNLK
jgi:beta-galactosidase